jgi:hypothetical protein
MSQEKLARYRDFAGDIDALAEAAREALAVLGLADAGGLLTSRLVRDYAQRGILSRPARYGRQAHYEYRQLVELVAARALIRDGWPLSKIAELVATASTDDLLAMISPLAGREDAAAAVRAIRSRATGAGQSLAETAKSRPQHHGATVRAARLAGLRADLAPALDALGGTAPPPVAAVIEFQLAPDLRLQIGQERLARLSLTDAELIGRAVVAALVAAAPKGAKP